LAEVSEGRYEGDMGPFDPGTQVRWYINVTDTSANRNTAFYPPDMEPLIFTVKTEENPVPLEFLIIGGTLVIIVVVAIVYWYKKRR
jgi:hypothetical protein